MALTDTCHLSILDRIVHVFYTIEFIWFELSFADNQVERERKILGCSYRHGSV